MPPSFAASYRCIIPNSPSSSSSQPFPLTLLSPISPSTVVPLHPPSSPIDPACLLLSSANFSRPLSHAPHAFLLISHHHCPLNPSSFFSAGSPAGCNKTRFPSADKVRPMIMWAHLSGVCFTSSGDHSEDKEAGEEGGCRGGIRFRDRLQRGRERKGTIYFTCILWDGLFIYLFSSFWLNYQPMENDQLKSKQCSITSSLSSRHDVPVLRSILLSLCLPLCASNCSKRNSFCSFCNFSS